MQEFALKMPRVFGTPVVDGLAAILCAAAMGAAASPAVRADLRSRFLTDYRTVTSTVASEFTGAFGPFVVAKVKTRDALYLEIYQRLGLGQSRLVDRIQLGDRRDAYFNFNGRATNLAIADLDGAGQPAILAPTFDDDLVGHMNVFRYDPARRGFVSQTR